MNDSIANSVAARLRLERTRLKLSQAQLAEAGGVATPTQVGYEQGTRKPDIDYLRGVETIGVDVGFLITGVPQHTLAAECLDWKVLAQIVHGINAWCDERELEIETHRLGELLQLLYIQFVARRHVEPKELKRVLKLVA